MSSFFSRFIQEKYKLRSKQSTLTKFPFSFGHIEQMYIIVTNKKNVQFDNLKLKVIKIYVEIDKHKKATFKMFLHVGNKDATMEARRKDTNLSR